MTNIWPNAFHSGLFLLIFPFFLFLFIHFLFFIVRLSWFFLFFYLLNVKILNLVPDKHSYMVEAIHQITTTLSNFYEYKTWPKNRDSEKQKKNHNFWGTVFAMGKSEIHIAISSQHCGYVWVDLELFIGRNSVMICWLSKKNWNSGWNERFCSIIHPQFQLEFYVLLRGHDGMWIPFDSNKLHRQITLPFYCFIARTLTICFIRLKCQTQVAHSPNRWWRHQKSFVAMKSTQG
jgi:hypothetical protein